MLPHTGTGIDDLLAKTLAEIEAGRHEMAVRIVLDQTGKQQSLLLYWLAHSIAQASSPTHVCPRARELVVTLDPTKASNLRRAYDLARALTPVLDHELRMTKARLRRFAKSPELIRDIAQSHVRSLEQVIRINRVLIEALQHITESASGGK